MPRRPRGPDPGAVHHITVRGNNHRRLFYDKKDYSVYKQIVAQAKRLFQMRLYHYNLMANHVHMEMHTHPDHSHSKVMKFINQQYALWHKRRYDYKGHLYDDRFWNNQIRTDRYMMNAAFYIEMNPVAAGIVKRPEDYRWSSYRYYALGEKDDLVDRDPLVEGLGDPLKPDSWRVEYVLQMTMALELMKDKPKVEGRKKVSQNLMNDFH